MPENTMVKGKFHESELKILDDRIASYKAEKGYTDSDLCPTLRASSSRRKDLGIWKELHDLLPHRSQHSVYQAAQRRIMASHAKEIAAQEGTSVARGMGSWDTAALARLTIQQSTHGSNWADIGRAMGRSGDECKKAFDRMQHASSSTRSSSRGSNGSSGSIKGTTKNFFDSSEDEQLRQAVLQVTGAATVADVPLALGSSWAVIAEKLGNKRSADDYRRRWRRLAIYVMRELNSANSIQRLAIHATWELNASLPVPNTSAPPVSVRSTTKTIKKGGSKERRRVRSMKVLMALQGACSAQLPVSFSSRPSSSSSSRSAASDSDSDIIISAPSSSSVTSVTPISIDSFDWNALGALLMHTYPREDVQKVIRKAAEEEEKEKKRGAGANDSGSDQDSDSDAPQRVYRYCFTSVEDIDGTLPLAQVGFASQIRRICGRYSIELEDLRSQGISAVSVPASLPVATSSTLMVSSPSSLVVSAKKKKNKASTSTSRSSAKLKSTSAQQVKRKKVAIIDPPVISTQNLMLLPEPEQDRKKQKKLEKKRRFYEQLQEEHDEAGTGVALDRDAMRVAYRAYKQDKKDKKRKRSEEA